jgi:hypothetical protein
MEGWWRDEIHGLACEHKKAESARMGHRFVLDQPRGARDDSLAAAGMPGRPRGASFCPRDTSGEL